MCIVGVCCLYFTISVSLHRGVHLGAATEEGEVCKGDEGWKCPSEEDVGDGAAASTIVYASISV